MCSSSFSSTISPYCPIVMHILLSSRRGFTLIELLVVIAIIAILSTVALASYSTVRAKGRDARRLGDMRAMRAALEQYYDSNQTYPVATSSLVSSGFMNAAAVPPTGGSYYYSATTAATGASRTACSTTPCPGYVLYAQLERNDNVALTSDADVTVGTTYYGANPTCTSSTAGTDSCYDVSN